MHRSRQAAWHLLVLTLALLVPWPAFAEKAMGLLNISASAPAATVYIDGVEAGQIPFIQMVPEGSHTVRIVADRFDPYQRKVDVLPNVTTRVDARLIPGKGTVEFNVKPAGARVYIDDSDAGPSPIRLREISEGEHRYRLEAPGYAPREGTFEFKMYKNLYIEEELRSTAGLFHVESVPPGAEVFIDGVSAGVTPLDLTDVPGGKHAVRLSMDGFAQVFRQVDTSDGSMGDVRVRLSERGSRLVVRTGRGDARVLVAGTEVGQGRKVVIRSMDAGSATVVVEATGYQSLQKSVRVPKNGRTAIRARLARADSSKKGQVVVLKPVLERWTFWAASSAVAVSGGVGGWFVWDLTRPPPLPEGDVQVPVP